MTVLILAAGYGTRLYSLGKDTPKALLEIQNKALIDYLLDTTSNSENSMIYKTYDCLSKLQNYIIKSYEVENN